MKLVAPKKIRAFDFQKIPTFLLLDTKGLEVNIQDEHLTEDNIQGLIEAFEWCLTHLEVKLIHIKTKASFLGFNSDSIKNLSCDEILELAKSYLTLLDLMRKLPQTIIFELNGDIKNEAITIFLMSDIKVCHQNNSLQFNQLDIGYIDIGLQYLINFNSFFQTLQAHYMSSDKVELNSLVHLGLKFSENILVNDLLNKISNQSNMARAQSKHGLVEHNYLHDNHHYKILNLLKSVLIVDDYKMSSEFQNLRNVKEKFADLNLN